MISPPSQVNAPDWPSCTRGYGVCGSFRWRSLSDSRVPGVDCLTFQLPVSVEGSRRKTETINSFAVQVRESNGKNLAEIRARTVCKR